jgi:octaprenyl-diphosphate synthase
MIYFDYENSAIGKPTGNDIQEKKVTLPLLYALNNCSSALKRKLIRIVKHKSTDKASVDFLINEAEKIGGFKYAEEKMRFYRDKAIEQLDFFPHSEVRSSLTTLVSFLTERAN